MDRSKQLKKVNNFINDDEDDQSFLMIALMSLFSLLSALLFFLKKHPVRTAAKTGPKLDIEIRYDTEKDADSTFLAQNLVKIIRMVLTPIESQIEQENAKLIFVYGDDAWEMRLRNASDPLKTKVRNLLEAQEW